MDLLPRLPAHHRVNLFVLKCLNILAPPFLPELLPPAGPSAPLIRWSWSDVLKSKCQLRGAEPPRLVLLNYGVICHSTLNRLLHYAFLKTIFKPTASPRLFNSAWDFFLLLLLLFILCPFILISTWCTAPNWANYGCLTVLYKWRNNNNYSNNNPTNLKAASHPLWWGGATPMWALG